MKKRRKNIALFGLSANPVTDRGGHGEIVKALLAMERIKTNGDDDDDDVDKLYDEVWVVPVYRHAFESKNDAMLKTKMPNFQQRCEMCEKQFSIPGEGKTSVKRVKVRRIELEATEWKRKVTGDANATIVGTFELLDYLRNVYEKEKDDFEKRNIEYTFVMGKDAYDDLISGKWIRGDEILKTTNLVVVPRISSTAPTTATATPTMIKEAKSVVFLDNISGLRDVSSTAVREAISSGNKPSTIEELNPFVAEFIEENRLYK
jgi:nicotinic acid mononucleotide adenylyltransferase